MSPFSRSLIIAAISASALGGARLAAQSRFVSWTDRPALIGFGVSLALSGEELFVGRTGEPPGFPLPPSQSGSVHVFRRAGATGGWTEAGSISGSDTKLADGFGSALAVDGDLLVVGAPRNGSGGAVYVFERRASGWEQTARLSGPSEAAGDEFGAAVAIKAGTLLVGAPGRDSARGAAYAYRRSPQGAWGEAVKVVSGALANDRLGTAVAVAGSRALIGAPGRVPLGGFGGSRPELKPGASSIYRVDAAGTWGEEAKLVPGAEQVLAYGFAVNLTDSEALVSAPLAGNAAGAIYRFRPGPSGWTPAGKLQSQAPTPNTAFGFSIARTADALLIGAPVAANATGEVHVFLRNGADWVPRQKLTGKSEGLGVMFGAAVAVQGDVAVIGGPMAQFFEGAGFVYTRDPGTGGFVERGTVVDKPASLPAVTGGEVRCADGKASGFDCQQVDLLSFIPTSALGAKRGIMLNDIWGWTDPETSREYALVGRMDGTVFVDVTDPANPVYVGELPLHQGARPNLWRDIKVYKNHAFIVSDGAGPHGVQVFDLTRLRNVTNRPATFTEDAHYNRIASAHNIAINEESGFAYSIGNSMGGETCGGALHMIDIREPKSPKFAGCYADPSTGNARTGYTHDTQCVIYKGPDTRYRGREICFNSSETALGIADVTDKQNPKPIAAGSHPNTAYTHQGWLTEDQRYFLLDDEGDELAGLVPRTRTIVWDITNLEEPVVAKEYLGETGATDHNLYVKGRYAFESNYVSGLRVIDISDPKNPREVGYFDTVPFGENVPGFAGSWSNYPFFRSGTIVVTSMREGLFVVRHRPSELVP
ncbi:MAG TPA: choice-of-anchor B family protein [Gemmatimonadales bacterium]